MTSIVVPIAEVVPQAATRARGKEVFALIIDRMGARDERPLRMVVDIRQASILTASFLDELVLRKAEMPKDTTLVFWLGSEDRVKTLKEVCAARGVRCYYQVGDDQTVRYTRRMNVPSIRVREYEGSFLDMLRAR